METTTVPPLVLVCRFYELQRCNKLRPFPVNSAIETQYRRWEQERWIGGGDQTLQSQGTYSEQLNSDAGAPCSAVNGSPLHLLFKSFPLKGSLCFAMDLSLLLCFFTSASVTGGTSSAAEHQVLPSPIEPSLAAPVPHSLFPATPCLARAAADAALWYGFRGECRFKNKYTKSNKGSKRMEHCMAAQNRCNSQSPRKSRTESLGPLLRSVIKNWPQPSAGGQAPWCGNQLQLLSCPSFDRCSSLSLYSNY